MRRFIYRVFVQSATNVLRVFYPIVMMLIIDVRLALIALSVLPAKYLITYILQKKTPPGYIHTKANTL